MSEKILVVDDDIDTLRLVGLMLQRQGYQVVAASNGNQALIMAQSENPDLVLLDVMMPDMDGYEVARRLRANPSTNSTPIIMFTAKSQVDDKIMGFESGVDDYLINIIVILPLMVSAVILIYSIFSLYKTTPLYSDIPLVIIISHVLIAFPFANKIVASARATISQEMLDVGKSLGLNRTALFFKIELPLLWSGILVAGIFSFAISIGEFAATFFITRSNTATIPLGIYRLISLRDIAGASALSSILIIVTLGIFYFMERFSKFDLRI